MSWQFREENLGYNLEKKTKPSLAPQAYNLSPWEAKVVSRPKTTQCFLRPFGQARETLPQNKKVKRDGDVAQWWRACPVCVNPGFHTQYVGGGVRGGERGRGEGKRGGGKEREGGGEGGRGGEERGGRERERREGERKREPERGTDTHAERHRRKPTKGQQEHIGSSCSSFCLEKFQS